MTMKIAGKLPAGDANEITAAFRDIDPRTGEVR